MALILTRAAGQAVYLGRHLNADDLEGTYQVKIVVRDVPGDGWARNPRAILDVYERVDGVVLRPVAVALNIHTPSISVPLSTMVELLRVAEDYLPGQLAPRCTAMLAIDSPRDVRILRDNARVRQPKEALEA